MSALRQATGLEVYWRVGGLLSGRRSTSAFDPLRTFTALPLGCVASRNVATFRNERSATITCSQIGVAVSAYRSSGFRLRC